MYSITNTLPLFLLTIAIPMSTMIAQDVSELEPPIIQLDTGTFAASEINCLAISHDDSKLAVGGGKEVRIWEISSGRLLHTLRGYMEPDGFNIGKVNAIAFSGDDRFLVVGVTDNSELGSTRIYDLQRTDGALTLVPGHTGCTLGTRMSDDGTEILTYGCSGALEVIKIDANQNRSNVIQEIPITFDHNTEANQTPLFVTYPSDRWVVIRSYQSVVVVDRSSSKQISSSDQWPRELRQLLNWESQLEPPHLLASNKFSSEPALVNMTSGAYFARGGVSQSSSSSQFWVAVYRVGANSPTSIYKHHRFSPTNVVFSPSGSLVVSSDMLGEVHVWDSGDSSLKLRLKTKNRSLFGVEWQGDQQILLGTEAFQQSNYRYNSYGALDVSFSLADRTSLRKLSASRSKSRAPATVLATQFGRVLLKESYSSEGVTFTFTPPYNNMAIEPLKSASISAHIVHKGDLIVGHDNGVLTQLRLSEGVNGSNGNQYGFKIVRSFRGHRGLVSSLDISEDEVLASCSVDGTVRFWSLSEPKPNGDLSAYMEGNRVAAIYQYANESQEEYAERAGKPISLEQGDTLLKFNEQPFYERRLAMARGQYEPGQKVPIVFQRGGQTLRTTVTLTESSRDAEPLATMYIHEDDSWIIWTPEGFYDCSPDGEKYVGWHLNRGRQFPAQYFGVGQFRKRLYSPEQVTKSIIDSRSTAAVSILEKSPAAPLASAIPAVHTSGGIDASRPPLVRIISPSDDELISTYAVDLVVEVEAKEDLREQNLLVLINGRRLSGEKKLSEQSVENGMVKSRYKYKCELDQPLNFVRASASHQRADSNIERIQIRRANATRENPDAGRLFVLAIGVANYNLPEWRLKAAAKDATAFCEKMAQMEGGMFEKVNVSLLTDEQATPNNIRTAMGEIVANATRINDVVYFFLSGHAIKANDTFRFLCADYDDKNYRTTSIGVGEINDWFQNELKAKAIMFADTCHAAGVARIRARGGIASPWQGTSRLILSACGPNSQSYESDEHGYFTQAILDACTNPDLADKIPSDRRLTVSELKAYLEFEVEKVSKSQQRPLLYDPGEASSVVFFEFR